MHYANFHNKKTSKPRTKTSLKTTFPISAKKRPVYQEHQSNTPTFPHCTKFTHPHIKKSGRKGKKYKTRSLKRDTVPIEENTPIDKLRTLPTPNGAENGSNYVEKSANPGKEDTTRTIRRPEEDIERRKTTISKAEKRRNGDRECGDRKSVV